MPARSAWSRLPLRGDVSTDERYTPRWILDLVIQVMGAIDLDPCADPRRRVPASTHFTKEDDGLEQPWAGRVFLNPPYSGASKWFRHLCLYWEAGRVTEAMILVPVTSIGTRGSRLLLKSYASSLVIFDRSLNFLGEDYRRLPTASPIPLCLIYGGANGDRFLELFGGHGCACIVHKQASGLRRRQCQKCGKIFNAKRTTAKFCSANCRVLMHRRS